MAGDEAMIVAGIGCRRGATADAVGAAIAAAAARCGLERGAIDALATAAGKSDEQGIAAAALALSAALVFVTPAQMRDAAVGALTVSARIVDLMGVPSIAETAALAAAGRSARLLAPRIATDMVTCAIAVGDGP